MYYAKISDDQIKWKTKNRTLSNSSKLQSNSCRKRQHRYHWHKHIWVFTFLGWYKHFNKSGGGSLGLSVKITNLFICLLLDNYNKRKEHKWKSFFLLLKTFKLFGPQFTWWRWFQKHTVPTKFDIYDEDDVRFVIDKYAEWDLYNTSSLKQQFQCRHVV
jgi:hypothetical protein